MNMSSRFSPELRERAARMVQEHRGEYPLLGAEIESIALRIGFAPQIRYEWLRKRKVDTGVRDAVASDEREHVKTLDGEVKELRRVN